MQRKCQPNVVHNLYRAGGRFPYFLETIRSAVLEDLAFCKNLPVHRDVHAWLDGLNRSHGHADVEDCVRGFEPRRTQ